METNDVPIEVLSKVVDTLRDVAGPIDDEWYPAGIVFDIHFWLEMGEQHYSIHPAGDSEKIIEGVVSKFWLQGREL